MVPRVPRVLSTWARGPVEADPPLWLCSKHWPLIQEAGAALSAPRGREGALKYDSASLSVGNILAASATFFLATLGPFGPNQGPSS